MSFPCVDLAEYERVLALNAELKAIVKRQRRELDQLRREAA